MRLTFIRPSSDVRTETDAGLSADGPEAAEEDQEQRREEGEAALPAEEDGKHTNMTLLV